MFNGRELVSVAGKAGKTETQHSTNYSIGFYLC